MATMKPNLCRFSTSEDFTVQKNICVQEETSNDRWFNRFSYSLSNIHSLPYLSTVVAVDEDLWALVSNAL